MAFYQGGQTYFQHQDWEGTERARTTYNGGMQGSYSSLAFGDGYSAWGDNDPYHYASLDQDSTSMDHALFRQYSNLAGRWMSPDPYSGSYDDSNPQSMNRYAYTGNNPLSMIDPSGLGYIWNENTYCWDFYDGQSDTPTHSVCGDVGPGWTNQDNDTTAGPTDGGESGGGGGLSLTSGPQVKKSCQQSRALAAVSGAQIDQNNPGGQGVGGHATWNILVTPAQLSADGFSNYFTVLGTPNGYRTSGAFVSAHVNGRGSQADRMMDPKAVLQLQVHIDIFNPASNPLSWAGHGIWDLGIGTLLSWIPGLHHNSLLDPACPKEPR